MEKKKRVYNINIHMKFILFHGAFGSPDRNWMPNVKNNLESLGEYVIAPRFPVNSWDEITTNGKEIPPSNQNLENWIKIFDPIAKTLQKGEKLCFVGHSLGPLFILHIVSRYDIQLDSAIFVCPFLDTLHHSWQIDHVNASFYKTDFNFKTLRKRIPISYSLYSDNDPYVPVRYTLDFAKNLNGSLIEVRGAGHMNTEFGFTSLPLVTELCKTRMERLMV
jgi:predicted alpha/beta hydrolase family esterase